MRSIGSALIFFGAGSAVLHFIGYEFRLLMWIDNWGETVGWIIRGALVIVGAAIVLFGNSSAEAEASDGEEQAGEKQEA